MAASDKTSIRVSRETRDQLAEAKIFDSMSFDDLLQDMVEDYSVQLQGYKSGK